jgi:cysteine desulfurase
MSPKPFYFDYQAATPIDPRVMDTLFKAYADDIANPSAESHSLGWSARSKVDTARTKIAQIVGAQSDEIYFTSGATEANNIGVLGAALAAPPNRRRILVGATDHKAVLEPAYAAEEFGFTVEKIAVDSNGKIIVDAFEEMLADDIAVISVMAVNNEIGVIQDIAYISNIAASCGAFLHCDATQAPLALAVDVADWQIDAASFSSHKIYGPKAIGALFVSSAAPWRPRPMLYGGGQEGKLRPGTLPTSLCVAFAEAFSILEAEGEAERKHVSSMRDYFQKRLCDVHGSAVATAADVDRHPGNLHIRFPGVNADDFLARLQPEISAATGSACTSGTVEASHVLEAIGWTNEQSMEAVRFSIGRFSSIAEIDAAVALIEERVYL